MKGGRAVLESCIARTKGVRIPRAVGFPILVVLAALAFMFAPDAAGAGTINVPEDHATIQGAIDASNSGDVIIVADGTYTGSGNKNLDFNGKAVRIKSSGGPTVCIIDCQGSSRGFSFMDAEGSDSIVEGFTITGGSAIGGGIYCVDSSPTVINCIITQNVGTGSGGGVYCAVSNPTLTNCIISSNSTNMFGGGIYCDRSSPTLINCLITGNTASSGGGFFCVDGADAVLKNCTIADNSSNTYGGGIWCENDSDPTVHNCIIWSNDAVTGADQIYTADSGSCVALLYSCCPTGAADMGGNIPIATIGAGCITDDPLFVDAAGGNYRLQSTSPCIDTGDNSLVPASVTEDLDGNDRIIDGDDNATAIVDMGAYEFLHVIYVKTDGSDADSGLTWETAVQTIQKGIDRAIENGGDGWTVVVANGTYAGVGNRDLNFKGYDIKLKSRNGARNCIIDCESLGRGFYFFNAETSDAIVDGFTITNGLNDAGMINCSSASPTIRNCIIRSNSCTAMTGGGMKLLNSNSTIVNCVIANNYGENTTPAPYGGGLHIGGGSPTIINCTIVNNRAHQGTGGGIYCTGSATVTVNNSILWGNMSGSGAGVQDQVYVNTGSVTLNYCCLGSGRTGNVTENACITSDPEFVDAGSTGTANYGDYHLLGSSLCIDAGSDTLVPADITRDLDRNDRILGAAVDMGAYEIEATGVAPVVSVTTPASPSGSPVTIVYDLEDGNGDDCTVSFDYSIDSGANWTSCMAAGGDTNPQLNVSPGTGHTFLWDAETDLGTVVIDVMIRVTADDGGNGGSDNDITGEFAVDTSVSSNTPPVVAVTTPSSPASSPVTIIYDLTDDDGDSCTVTFDYSTNGGAIWSACTAASGDTNPQTGVPPGNGLTFSWDAAVDLPNQYVNVLVRVTADDGNGGSGDDTTAEFAVDTITPNTPPVASVTTPASPSSGDITITYTLADAESDTCSVTVEYSTDSGANWYSCSQGVGGDGVTGLDSSVSGATHTFVWASANDDVGTSTLEDAMIRITPHDGRAAGAPDVSGAFTVDNTSITTPLARFIGTPTSGSAALTVTFLNQSIGVYSSWLWNFGDGETSTEENPMHVYRLVGTYDVTLTIDGPFGGNQLTKVGYITVTDPGSITAEFSALPTSGKAVLTVQFTDLSVGDVESWSWDFGDGNTSIQRSPSHVYTEPGTYTVTLTVTGPQGEDTEIKVGYIVVSESTPVVLPKKKSGGCSCAVDCGPSSHVDLLGYFLPVAAFMLVLLALRRKEGRAKI